MDHKGMIRTASLLIAAASFLALGVRAQDEPSVADAARRARQQKQASAKPSSVVTNDTLRPAPTPAPAPSALPADAPATSTEDSAEAAESPERKAETDDEAEQKKRDVAKLKEEIAQKQQQLKFLKSDLALKQDTFYSNPDHQHDADGKTKLDSVKSDIKQAEDELAALQAKLAGLGPAAEAEPAPPSER
jgi:hypothetical protein